jgi:hypothetical protein
MDFGHSLSPTISEQPTLVVFPDQPWQLDVNIQIKQFSSLWRLGKCFKDQEVEISSDESIEMVWERIRQKVPHLTDFKEIGLVPRRPSTEMKVTMPRRDAEAMVKAVMNGMCDLLGVPFKFRKKRADPQFHVRSLMSFQFIRSNIQTQIIKRVFDFRRPQRGLFRRDWRKVIQTNLIHLVRYQYSHQVL